MSECCIIVAAFLVFGILIFGIGLFANNVIPQSCTPQLVYDLFRYGRANVPSKESSSLLKWIEVPKSWFAHFYLYCTVIQSTIFYHLFAFYVLKWTPSESAVYRWLDGILQTLARSHENSNVVSPAIALTVSLLFLVQVSRRFYETRYVSVYSDTKMNVAHYLLGFVHYTGSTLSLLTLSPGFAGKSREFKTHELVWSWADFGVWQWIGLALFLYGTVEQYRAHATFANLRRKGDKVVTKKHQIPRGGLFEYVSSPNYWAEILIYTSFGLIFSFQNTCWNAVLFWVVANQVTAGVMNHIWYLEKFPEYPKNRKAVIPFVW